MMSKKTVSNILLKICGSGSYMQPIYSKQNDRIIKYNIGPMGSQLQENFKRQWLMFHMSNLEISFFMQLCNISSLSTGKEFLENITSIKNMCHSRLPFGVACMHTYDNSKKIDQNGRDILQEAILNNDLKNNCQIMSLNPSIGMFLQSIVFVSPRNSRNFYFQWQRQRKIWWSRFSVSPGLISIQEEKNSVEEHLQNKVHLANLKLFTGKRNLGMNISIELESQLHPVELIELFEPNPETGLSIEENSNFMHPHVIVSTINLDIACLGILLECLDEDKNLMLHHKLAPFQYRVVCDYKDIEEPNELTDLAHYLCGLLRKAHLLTFHISNDEKPLQEVFKESDQMGVPYCLVLRKDTLKKGFIYLRSRDTTLEEQLHISDVPNYLVKLCKNF